MQCLRRCIWMRRWDWEEFMGKTAFLFSGQGAQAPGMMRDYHDSVPEARRVFETADAVLGRSISGLCFEGSQEELNLTHNTQPCVLAADLAAYEVALASGLEPDGLAGYSLGEYAALVVAGCLSMEEAFALIQIRADAMQDAVPVGKGAMVAVLKQESNVVEGLCSEVAGYVVCANYNSPALTVVAGEAAAVDEFLSVCKSRKVRAMRLPVSAPFHCKLMAPAAECLGKAIAPLRFSDPRLPVYMNVDALPLEAAESLPAKMVAQAKSPVLWRQTLERMWADGFTRFVECGPGTTLSISVKKTLPDAEVATIGLS